MNINKKKDSKKLTYNLVDNDKETNLTININKTDRKKDGRYTINTTVYLNHLNKSKELYNLVIVNNFKLEQAKDIKENISNSEFASSLTDKEKKLIKIKKDNLINRFQVGVNNEKN